jgi:hypothetical protein
MHALQLPLAICGVVCAKLAEEKLPINKVHSAVAKPV